jgi:RND family efflux transporter MFP subunit
MQGYRWQVARWPRLSTGLVLVAGLGAGLAGCGRGGSAATAGQGSDVVVALGARDVAEARIGEVNAGVSLTGSLQPYRVVNIFAQVPGTVAGIRFDRGERVERGAVLASIEADGIRSQATGAQAAVAAAEAGLALAVRQLESARTLFEAGAMSELDLRGAEASHAAAQAQLAAARAQAAGAGESARRATVAAPITGVISDRQVEAGEAVNPGQKLFTVVNAEILELAGQVPVESAGWLRAGLPVVFELKSLPGQTFRGEVARVDPVADGGTRQVGVYVRLPNPGGRIVGGQFATGRVVGERLAEAVVVPEAAVRESGGESYLLVIEGGTVVRRQVELGMRDVAQGVVAIASGVRAGELVLAAPGATLPPGTKVRVNGAPVVPLDSPAGEG